ncbi:MAG TPA: hypothetical protein DDW30_08740 [Clostridiales bacterium]|nr:hypothetical protein [Clostridiales bacterium]
MSRLAILCMPSKASLGEAAERVAVGALSNGAQPDCFDVSGAFDPSVLSGYDAAAFGLGAGFDREAFLSLFSNCLSELKGKRIGFFGETEENAELLAALARFGEAVGCRIHPLSPAEVPAALGSSLVRKKELRPDLAGVVPIIFSTITGNGYKLAVAAAEAVPDHVGPYNIRYINDEVIDKFDTFVLSYWCNHGTADDDTIDLIARMRGKKLIVIGSLGVSVDTAHAAKVCENVTALASEHNILLGHYLCRGSIDLRRTFARTRIPEGEKGHLSMERFEKQKQSLGHPNAEELDGARRAVAEFLKKA